MATSRALRAARPAADTDHEALVASRATIRAAGILGVRNAELARIVGLSEAQISRVSHGQAVLEGKARELGLLFVRLFRGLAGIVGADDEAARSWLRSDNLALGARPIDRIQTVNGLVEAVAYVDSRRARL